MDPARILSHREAVKDNHHNNKVLSRKSTNKIKINTAKFQTRTGGIIVNKIIALQHNEISSSSNIQIHCDLWFIYVFLHTKFN